MKRATLMLAVALLLGGVGHARAGSVVYTFSGIASGRLNNTWFTNEAFTITVTADTANIVDFGGIHPTPTVESNPATISIATLGTGTFVNPTGVFDNPSTMTLGFGNYLSHDMLDLELLPFATYGLSTSSGPVYAVSPWFATTSIPLSDGTLHFSSVCDVTFSAAAASTPEPASLTLLGICITGLAGYAWRRRKLAA